MRVFIWTSVSSGLPEAVFHDLRQAQRVVEAKHSAPAKSWAHGPVPIDQPSGGAKQVDQLQFHVSHGKGWQPTGDVITEWEVARPRKTATLPWTGAR